MTPVCPDSCYCCLHKHQTELRCHLRGRKRWKRPSGLMPVAHQLIFHISASHTWVDTKTSIHRTVWCMIRRLDKLLETCKAWFVLVLASSYCVIGWEQCCFSSVYSCWRWKKETKRGQPLRIELRSPGWSGGEEAWLAYHKSYRMYIWCYRCKLAHTCYVARHFLKPTSSAHLHGRVH